MYKPSYPHPVLAREGWPFIAGSVILALLVTWWSAGVGLIFWLLAIFVIQFFRDPQRQAPDGDRVVLAPADGRIVSVDKTIDPYTQQQALKISVFMNVFNVHSNRFPVSGRVTQVQYFPGSFVNAALDKASVENERNAVHISLDSGEHVTVVQVAGLVARRILCYVKTGDTRRAGERYGFIRFGSRVDVYLPPESRPRVAIGDKVSATSTALADLPEIVVAANQAQTL